MNISIKSIVSAISLALDLSDNNWNKCDTLIDPTSNVAYSLHRFSNHCKRTTYIALEIGKQLNLDKNSYYNLYISSLIHDIGTQNIFHMAHDSHVYMKQHCAEGYEMLKDMPTFSEIAEIIKYHHENYNGTGCFELKYASTPIESQIIRLADLVETQLDFTKPYYINMNVITEWIKARNITLFSNQLVNAFSIVALKESFWLNLYNKNSIDTFLNELAPMDDKFMSLYEFEQLSDLFATIIDNKSSFTASHSKEISKLSYRISKHLGYDDEKALKMKISGLLHDIGKLAIPTEILDKEGPLNDEEFAIIRSHTYYTKLILDKIDNLNDISLWASSHHEKLTGNGYPRRLTASELSEECRILAVCDIYQSLTANRPYRIGMSNSQAFAIMDEMVARNQICNDALKALKVMILDENGNNIADINA